MAISTPRLDIRTDPGGWVLEAQSGRSRAQVSGDPATISAILSGDRSGLEAFLRGKVAIKGSLSLALQMETLFESDHHPTRWARAGRCRAAGVDTFYLECGHGRGTPVILLHGLGATNASFLPTLWDLSARHHVIAPDLPGHGESGKPIRRYDAAFYARWLEAFMTARGIKRAHLVGNSLGGRIALEMAITHPLRVRSISLLAAAPIVHRLRRLVPVVRLLRPELSVIPLPVLRGHALAGIKSLFARSSRVPQAWYESAADEFVRIFREPAARIAFFSSLREIYLEEPLGDAGYWARLKTVRCPTLLIWGDRDPLVPLRHARAVSAAIPHATSITLRNCGHVPQYEMPQATNDLIESFLAPREPAPARR